MNFSKYIHDEDYFYGDTRIPSVPSARLLGVNFVEQVGKGKRINLNNMQKDQLIKLKQAIGAVTSNVKYAEFNTLVTIYNSYLLPIIGNTSQLWAPYVDYTAEKPKLPNIVNQFNNQYKKFFAMKKCPPDFDRLDLPSTPEEFWLMQDLVMYADIYMGRSCLKTDEIFNVDLENLVIDAKGNKKIRFGKKIAPSITFKNSFRYRRAKLFDESIPDYIKVADKEVFKSWVKYVFIPRFCRTSDIIKSKILNNETHASRYRHATHKKHFRKKYEEALKYQKLMSTTGFLEIDTLDLFEFSPVIEPLTVDEDLLSDSSVDTDEEEVQNPETDHFIDGYDLED